MGIRIPSVTLAPLSAPKYRAQGCPRRYKADASALSSVWLEQLPYPQCVLGSNPRGRIVGYDNNPLVADVT